MPNIFEEIRKQKGPEPEPSRWKDRTYTYTPEEARAEMERRRAERARDDLRAQVLRGTTIQDKLQELGEFTGANWLDTGDDGDHGTAIIGYSSETSHYRDEKTIKVQAIEDGSVRIGNRTLSASEARDPKQVEEALDHAYRTTPFERKPRYHQTIEDHGEDA